MPLNNRIKLKLKFKRVFDFFFALTGLVILFPVIILSWIVVSYETRSNGIFVQERIGLYGKRFKVFKIKTMRPSLNITTTNTSINDSRITKSGAFFRKSKIDELPQLWNVLVGQMSFVGPRPDVAGYADKLVGEDRIILEVRPGITGPASLKYRNEEYLLSKEKDPDNYNDKVIWPDKVLINKGYVYNYSFRADLIYIFKTIVG